MGLDLGLEQEGIEILLACEIDQAARNTIKLNRPDIALIGDIRDYSATEIRERAGLSPTEDIDLIVCNPPDSIFDLSDKQLVLNGQNNLFLKFIDLISELQPKFIVIETMPELLNLSSPNISNLIKKINHPTLCQEKEIGNIFSFVIHRLEAAEYGISFNFYNAADFGSPQQRSSIFIVCNRDGKKLPYLTPTHTNNSLNELPEWQTLRDAIGKTPGNEHRSDEFLKEGLRKISIEDKNRIISLCQRLDWDKPSPRLLAEMMFSNNLVHPEADRWLNIEECKRIQELPDDWQIVGHLGYSYTYLNSQYRLLGNATPCSLGRAIARMLMTYLEPEESMSYAKKIEKIENIFKSIETLGEWEKEVHSFNPLSQYEKYFQIATSK